MKTIERTHFDVVVIGGGASGMMVAGVAGARGKSVLLLEKNARLGEKLRITGGGRCNITSAEPDVRAFLKHYGSAEQFLYSTFAQFGVAETFIFFEKLGLPLVTQEHKRVFPKTERAADVVQVLEQYMKKWNVQCKTGSAVTRIVSDKNGITGIISGGKTYTAHSYVLATGGLSHPETGSTGDGFRWLSNLGHSVDSPTPSIVPVAVKENWVRALSGVSIQSAKITFFVDGAKKISKTGKILFTHFGISGPMVLNVSGKVGELLHTGAVTASIDLYPTLDLGALDTKIISIFDANKNKIFKNVLDEIVPQGMADVFLRLAPTIEAETKVHSISKEQRKDLVRILKALPLTITGLMGHERSVVTDGGISLSEIDTKTMRSLRCKNLFVTGDLLNIVRPSGGYSLQLCWTTGFVAGSNC